jgi:hypothetical protein
LNGIAAVFNFSLARPVIHICLIPACLIAVDSIPNSCSKNPSSSWCSVPSLHSYSSNNL